MSPLFTKVSIVRILTTSEFASPALPSPPGNSLPLDRHQVLTYDHPAWLPLRVSRVCFLCSPNVMHFSGHFRYNHVPFKIYSGIYIYIYSFFFFYSSWSFSPLTFKSNHSRHSRPKSSYSSSLSIVYKSHLSLFSGPEVPVGKEVLAFRSL